jgi:putative transcriptional regulator
MPSAVPYASASTEENRTGMESDSDAAAPAGPQSIRELRIRLGLTQEEFAHAIAVTVSTVNRWENGHATPSKLAWRAIQTLLRKRGTPRDRPGREHA